MLVRFFAVFPLISLTCRSLFVVAAEVLIASTSTPLESVNNDVGQRTEQSRFRCRFPQVSRLSLISCEILALASLSQKRRRSLLTPLSLNQLQTSGNYDKLRGGLRLDASPSIFYSFPQISLVPPYQYSGKMVMIAWGVRRRGRRCVGLTRAADMAPCHGPGDWRVLGQLRRITPPDVIPQCLLRARQVVPRAPALPRPAAPRARQPLDYNYYWVLSLSLVPLVDCWSVRLAPSIVACLNKHRALSHYLPH